MEHDLAFLYQEVFDPRGIRQMDMQACPLDSLLAGINLQTERDTFLLHQFEGLHTLLNNADHSEIFLIVPTDLYSPSDSHPLPVPPRALHGSLLLPVTVRYAYRLQ